MSFLVASVYWGVLVVVSTELLSVIDLLIFQSVVVFWALILAVLLVVLYKRNEFVRKCFTQFLIPTLYKVEWGMIIGIVIIIFNIGLIAYWAPPNTSDSMTYHMSRVMHWIQNHSVSNYPTNILRQLAYPPGAEYIILHFQLLSGSDRWANFVQWFSMAGSVLGVSLIAKFLRANRFGQIVSSLMAVTLPIGILQGSSTQNDYVVTFWLICFITIIFMMMNRLMWSYSISCGLALGLTLLTKGTGYIYAIPFLLIIILLNLKVVGIKLAKHFCVIVMIAICLNVPFYLRNFELYQNILAPLTKTAQIHHQSLTAPSLILNFIQNAGIHLGTPFENVNVFMENVIFNIQKFFKWGNLETSAASENSRFLFSKNPFHEDIAGNVLHFIFIFFTFFSFLFARKINNGSNIEAYLTSLIISIITFNIILAWQPFHGRFHLPLFILFSPWMAVVLISIFNKKLILSISFLLFIGALPWVIFNQSRPMLGEGSVFKKTRTEQYFSNLSGYMYSYLSTIDEIKSYACSQIGLSFKENSWEYPLWVYAKTAKLNPLRIEHVKIDNVSAIKATEKHFQSFRPCAVIGIDQPMDKTKLIIDERSYVRTRQTAYAQIFILDESGHLAKKSLEHYFNLALDYANQAVILLNQSDGKNVIQTGQIEKIVVLRKKALDEALLVDIKELDEIYPTLGQAWQTKLIEGLSQFTVGINEHNSAKFNLGQALLNEWNVWLFKNIVQLQKAFEHE